MTNNQTKLNSILDKQKELEKLISAMKDEVDIVVIKPEYHLICALIKPTPQGYGYSIKSVANLFRVLLLFQLTYNILRGYPLSAYVFDLCLPSGE